MVLSMASSRACSVWAVWYTPTDSAVSVVRPERSYGSWIVMVNVRVIIKKFCNNSSAIAFWTEKSKCWPLVAVWQSQDIFPGDKRWVQQSSIIHRAVPMCQYVVINYDYNTLFQEVACMLPACCGAARVDRDATKTDSCLVGNGGMHEPTDVWTPVYLPQAEASEISIR